MPKAYGKRNLKESNGEQKVGTITSKPIERKKRYVPSQSADSLKIYRMMDSANQRSEGQKIAEIKMKKESEQI